MYITVLRHSFSSPYVSLPSFYPRTPGSPSFLFYFLLSHWTQDDTRRHCSLYLHSILVYCIGIGMGDPGVFQAYPHPHPPKTHTHAQGMGFSGLGSWVYWVTWVRKPRWVEMMGRQHRGIYSQDWDTMRQVSYAKM